MGVEMTGENPNSLRRNQDDKGLQFEWLRVFRAKLNDRGANWASTSSVEPNGATPLPVVSNN